ncbi:TetR/AcrR family transcriptional regulator [Pseudomonas tolaasii]|uniref:TetR/AcrR family transcriptional regulator n=1 Tax=Pseudomonas tolaasii TaxID=29442 RepID=UPI001C5D8268|nr:TetR/AcrR family transcriptional regulator [Pseudomonas tolaasii]MBW4793575.1 TetR/AcrR family transcriptional regulator [Pseudomonas tolaasii]
MARKRAFDYDQAVDKAKVLFWQRGYVATGLRDLLTVMDIGESSFYNALKSKKHLYLACVQRYEDDVVARRLEALVSAPSAAAGIQAFFTAILDDLDTAQLPSPLCMVAAMVTDVVLSDPELRERAEQGLEAVRAIMCERLTEDQASGVLPASLDPQVTASVLLTYLQGLWRMALVKFERPGFEQQVHAFLRGMAL